MRDEIETGKYEHADALLARAEEADLAATRMAEELAQQATEASGLRLLMAASRRAERGELNLTRLNYLAAAEHFNGIPPCLP